MARVFIDGFETGSTSLWDYSYNEPITSSEAYGSNKSLYIDNKYAHIDKIVAPAQEAYFGFYWKHKEIISSLLKNVFSIFSGTKQLISIGPTDLLGGNWRVYNSSNWETIATGEKTIIPDLWYYISLYIKLHETEGRIILKVNNITDIDFTGNTLFDSETTFDKIVIGSTAGFESERYTASPSYYDNFVYDNSEFPTGTRICLLTPSGSGNTTQYTSSTGGYNYTCIDELIPSDDDFVYTNTENLKDTYKLENLTVNAESIKSVQVQSRAWYEDNAAVTKVSLIARTNNTDYNSDNIQLGLSPEPIYKNWSINPVTSLPWTIDNINNLEVGIQAKV